MSSVLCSLICILLVGTATVSALSKRQLLDDMILQHTSKCYRRSQAVRDACDNRILFGCTIRINPDDPCERWLTCGPRGRFWTEVFLCKAVCWLVRVGIKYIPDIQVTPSLAVEIAMTQYTADGEDIQWSTHGYGVSMNAAIEHVQYIDDWQSSAMLYGNITMYTKITNCRNFNVY